MEEYCPDCIIELVKDNKKLGTKYGSSRNWLVCPNCGYRSKPISWYEKSIIVQEFVSTIRENNNKNLNDD